MAKPHLEVVSWTDHAQQYGDNIDPKNVSLAKRASVGWVVLETEDALLLAHTKDEGSWADILAIAKPLISDRRKVK